MYDIVTFLTFEGNSEEAIDFYLATFKDSELLETRRYGPDEAGLEGTIEHATFRLNGKEYMAIDSKMKHEHVFTPSVSLFVKCESVTEIDELFTTLSAGGEVTMALDAYPFSERFGWLVDRFGVSWQLSLGEVL